MRKIRVVLLSFFFFVFAINNVSMSKSTLKNSLEEEISRKIKSIREFQLENGLKILLKEDHSVPIVSQALFYAVGSRNELKNKTGIAHYLEHMQFNGTKKISKSQISKEIEKRGGNFNAGTSNDFTVYYMTLPSKHLEFVLALEADRMKNSILDQKEADREREVVITELKSGDNNPASLLSKKLLKELYPNHAYGNPVIGWEDDLKKISEKDLRDFYQLYYQPSNAVLVLVGDFNSEQAVTLIKKYFGELGEPKKKEIPQVKKETKKLEFSNRKDQYVKVERPSQTNLIRFIWRAPSVRNPDFPVLKVISSVLSDGYLSRLEKKLIENNKASYVGAFEREGIDPFSFSIVATTPKKEALAEIEEIIRLELDNLIENGVSQEELERVKAKAETDFWFDLEDFAEMAIQLGFFESVANDWKKTFTWTSELNKVSSEDIKRVSKKYLDPKKALIGILTDLSPEDKNSNSDNNLHSKSQNSSESDLKRTASLKEEENRPLDDFYSKIKETKLKKEKNKIEFEELELKNGLKIIFREENNLPIFGLSLTVDAGESLEINYEEQKAKREFKNGTSFLTALMIEKGTKNYNKEQISKELEKRGAIIDISPEKDYISLQARGRAKDLSKVLEIISEELREPTFSVKELGILSKQSALKLEEEKDKLASLSSIKLSQMIYNQEHPYYQLSLVEQIQALSEIKVLELKNFHQKYYQPERIIISIVGDLKKEEVLKTIKENFEDWENKSKEQSFQVPLEELKLAKQKTIEVPGKVQALVTLGHSGELTRSSKDYYALALANDILGGGSSLASRLGAKIREEQGLVYSIYSGFRMSRGAGSFIIKMGIDPDKIDYALDLTKQEIRKFIKEQITDEELKRAKSYRIGSFLSGNLISNQDLATALNLYKIWGLPVDTINQYIEQVNLVTKDELKRASEKYFHPDKLQTVIYKPQQN